MNVHRNVKLIMFVVFYDVGVVLVLKSYLDDFTRQSC